MENRLCVTTADTLKLAACDIDATSSAYPLKDKQYQSVSRSIKARADIKSASIRLFRRLLDCDFRHIMPNATHASRPGMGHDAWLDLWSGPAWP
jgi:hypothetical protein